MLTMRQLRAWEWDMLSHHDPGVSREEEPPQTIERESDRERNREISTLVVVKAEFTQKAIHHKLA